MMMTVIQVLRAKYHVKGIPFFAESDHEGIIMNPGDGLSVMLDGKRKSTRGHQRPLEYWRNEHKVFGRDHKSE